MPDVADYLLDTNILDYWYYTARPEHANVLAHLDTVRRADPQTGYTSRLFISVITLGEIEYGHRVNPTPDKSKQAASATFVQEGPEALDITAHVAEKYGKLKAWLFNNYGPKSNRSKAKRAEELVDPTTELELGIQENDIWIAAQAMTHGLVLVTHDSRGNFGRVLRQFAAELHVQDWCASLGSQET